MALSRLSNPQDTVTAITAALWTSEFDNIYNNALSLISPLTGNLDLNGFKLPNLAAGTAGSPALPFTGDADTGVFRVGADEAGIAAAGAASMTFTNPASAVNYLKWSGSATGNAVAGTATGTDANVSVNLVPKGTGVLQSSGNGVVTVIDKATTTVDVVNTTTETDLYRFTVPAGMLGTNRALRLTITGDHLNNSGVTTQNLSLKLKYGASTLFTHVVGYGFTGTSRVGWGIDATLMNKGATNAQVARWSLKEAIKLDSSTGTRFWSTAYPNDNAVAVAGAVDSTSAQDIVVTATYSLADANLSIRRMIALLELLP